MLRLKMRNFQGIIFLWSRSNREIFESALVYLQRYSHANQKNYREMIASTWKINLEMVVYLSIKILELFTSKFKYLGIKVSKKSNFYLILCLFLDGTFSKIERDGKLFRKRCQNFTSRILSRWLYEDITCSGLLINKKQKAAYT